MSQPKPESLKKKTCSLLKTLQSCQYLQNPYKTRNGCNNLSTQAWKLTMFKKIYIFPIDLKLRVPVVALITLFPLKFVKGFKKIPIVLGTYYLASSVLAPEVVNPYYKSSYFMRKDSSLRERVGRKLKEGACGMKRKCKD